MIWFYLLIAAGAVAWWLRRRSQLPREGRPSAPVRVGPSEITFTRHGGESPRLPTPLPQATLLAAFRSDEQPAAEEHERADLLALTQALMLAAEHLGADDCVLWREDLDDDQRMLMVASARGREPVLGPSERAKIHWSAHEGVPTGDVGGEQQPRFLVAPVKVNERFGALSAHFTERAVMDRTALREWVGRHASAIGSLHDVLRTRAELARSNYRLRSIIKSAKILQSSRDPIALEQVLVRDAVRIAFGEWGLLVRWDHAQNLGTLKLATDGSPNFAMRATARQGSVIGEVCLSGVQRVISDTRSLVGSQEDVFDHTPLPPGTGSVLIIPMQRSDEEPVLGALVIGHSQLRGLQVTDGNALKELGVIAAGALETAWAHQAETARARTDQLTGLANRRSFEESFARMIGETDRYGGSAGLVLCDVDFFKKVNDTHGHEVGDQVLIAVAQALESGRRTTDSVSRVGGEELALLLPQTDTTGAMEVAERTRASIEALVVPTAAGDIRVTASFGVAMYTARSGTGGKLYDRADRALYAAKHGGRNRVELSAGEGAWSGA